MEFGFYHEKEADVFACKLQEVDVEHLELGDEIRRTGHVRQINAELPLQRVVQRLNNTRLILNTTTQPSLINSS